MLFIYNAQAGGLMVLDALTGVSITTLPSGRGHWNSAIVVDNRIALPEGAISGFGGGGGGGRGGRGGSAPAAGQAPAAAAIPEGIVNIWRLPNSSAGYAA